MEETRKGIELIVEGLEPTAVDIVSGTSVIHRRSTL